MTPEEIERIMTQAQDLLGDHFDCFQIMVSWNEEGLTKMRNIGGGNWYARQGMAHEFINADSAQTSALEISKVINPSEDE